MCRVDEFIRQEQISGFQAHRDAGLGRVHWWEPEFSFLFCFILFFPFSRGPCWPQTHYIAKDIALNFWSSCLHSRVLALQAPMPGLIGTRYRTQDFVHGRQAFYKETKSPAQEPSPLWVWQMLLELPNLLKVLRTVSGAEYITISQWQSPCLSILQNYYLFILIERQTHSTMLNPVPRKARVIVWHIGLTKITCTWFHRKRDYTIRAYLEICSISYYILVTLPCYRIDSYLSLFPHLLEVSLCSGVQTSFN